MLLRPEAHAARQIRFVHNLNVPSLLGLSILQLDGACRSNFLHNRNHIHHLLRRQLGYVLETVKTQFMKHLLVDESAARNTNVIV